MKTVHKRLSPLDWEDILATVEVRLTRFIITAILLLFIGLAAQAPSVETQLQAGLAAQGAQEYWRAEAFFQQAESLSPHDFRAPLYLGQLHLLERKDDLAESELDNALALASNNADIWLALGDLAQGEAHPDQAEHDWLQATGFQPTASAMQARERLGLLYEAQGRFPQAEAQFVALGNSDALALYHLGALRLERSDQSGARQAFQGTLTQTTAPALHAPAQQFLQVLNTWRGDAASWTQLGYTYLQNSLPLLAEQPLQHALTLADNDALTHAYLAWAYELRGLNDQADAEVQRSLALDPNASFANYVFSVLALEAGQYNSATQALERALLSDPHNPVLWATLGEIANARHDFTNAEGDFRHAADDANGDAQFALLLASFYLAHQRGLDDGSALNAAEQATHLDPTNGLAFDLLGRIQQARYDFSNALSALEQATLIDPTNATFHLHLGQMQYALNDVRAAELNLHKAIVLDTDADAINSIAHQAKDLLDNLPPLGL